MVNHWHQEIHRKIHGETGFDVPQRNPYKSSQKNMLRWCLENETHECGVNHFERRKKWKSDCHNWSTLNLGLFFCSGRNGASTLALVFATYSLRLEQTWWIFPRKTGPSFKHFRTRVISIKSNCSRLEHRPESLWQPRSINPGWWIRGCSKIVSTCDNSW